MSSTLPSAAHTAGQSAAPAFKAPPFWLPLVYKAFPGPSARVLAKRFLVPWKRLPGLEQANGAHRVTLSVDDRPVMVQAEGTGPVVILVHGWAGSSHQFRDLRARLLSLKYRVVTFDAPAHGASPGRSSNAGEFARLVTALQRLFGPALAVIGHSLGGLAAAMSAEDIAPRGLVLFCPMPSFEYALEQYQLVLRFDDTMRERIARHVERQAKVTRAAGRVKRGLDRGARTLLIHDADDRRVPVQSSRDLAGRFPHIQYIETAGLGHNRVLSDSALADQIAAFIGGLA